MLYWTLIRHADETQDIANENATLHTINTRYRTNNVATQQRVTLERTKHLYVFQFLNLLNALPFSLRSLAPDPISIKKRLIKEFVESMYI